MTIKEVIAYSVTNEILDDIEKKSITITNYLVDLKGQL